MGNILLLGIAEAGVITVANNCVLASIRQIYCSNF